jgi:hypothetical protein
MLPCRDRERTTAEEQGIAESAAEAVARLAELSPRRGRATPSCHSRIKFILPGIVGYSTIRVSGRGVMNRSVASRFTEQSACLHMFARTANRNSKSLKVKGLIWSGRRDLNPGPLAPQATNINYLQTTFTENTRLSPAKFGRQLDARAPKGCVWTPPGLHILAVLLLFLARLSSTLFSVWTRQQIIPI